MQIINRTTNTYIYIAVILKQNAEIHQYQNILFQWTNQNSRQNGTNNFDFSTTICYMYTLK